MQQQGKCNVCGYDMKKDVGRIVPGFKVELLGAHPERKRVEDIFGSNKFCICNVCLLSALGVKKLQ